MKNYELFIALGYEIIQIWGDSVEECIEQFAERFNCVYEDIRDYKHYFIRHYSEIIPDKEVVRELTEAGYWSDDEAMDELPFT